MSDLGKVDRAFFDEHIYPNLGADREDVRLAPQHGVDFGVIDAGEQVLALATDPVFVMPSLGFDRAAWFAFHILMSDVAVSGLRPTHLSIDLNLPAEITDEQFATVWERMHEEAEELGVSVVTGHTGRYAGCNYPMVGGGTALAVGDPDALVRPDGARAGDAVIVTKGPAIEATGLLSIQFEDLLDGEDLAAAKERFYDMSPVRDALVASAAGPVSAMHDATEGGVYGGLHEIARAGEVRIDVEREAVPVMDGVEETCAAFDIDPWISISEGTLLLTVESDGAEAVLSALESEDIPAAVVGEASAGEGVYFDGEPVERPERDPFWAAFEKGMAELEEAR
ncbi:AIR synthase family protein [Halalkalicoccus jeotgali]|uniref:AIR synthase related protein domain protein n=1 Tax=Halalkalicoccus jeotgali (strain DSM 18796 / CECT 7217 / JCM 14584 / KCTC 4019 / B3) TaxID=795797 RepID=D8J8K5_HALJB|nr:AIR synthase family protein [Halalkalicoccus jeotgali]ADJ16251.1 AIR synthase related protein domain protein [Halalkalicoccus jeotgali B3]ELY36986.1 AIR synthase-like protein domain-containing protein [Halalkalicoccus jeotgali B3]